MNAMGHNQKPMADIAADARRGLDMVASGEETSIEGWLIYGAALNEGRDKFHPEDDKGFGRWVNENLLFQLGSVEIHPADRPAAMWAASEYEQFAAMREQFPNVRTVRGWHAKWNALKREDAVLMDGSGDMFGYTDDDDAQDRDDIIINDTPHTRGLRFQDDLNKLVRNAYHAGETEEALEALEMIIAGGPGLHELYYETPDVAVIRRKPPENSPVPSLGFEVRITFTKPGK